VIEERFIARKARDGAEFLAAKTSLGNDNNYN